MSPKALEARDGGVVIRVRVQPRASREAITGDQTAIKVALTAPPVDGEANAALLQLLARRLGLPKTALRLVSGEKSRDKAVFAPEKRLDEVAQALGMKEE